MAEQEATKPLRAVVDGVRRLEATGVASPGMCDRDVCGGAPTLGACEGRSEVPIHDSHLRPGASK